MAEQKKTRLGRVAVKLKQLDGKIRQLLNRQTRQFETHMVTNRLSGPTGPESLSSRTGHLRKSLRHEVRQFGPQTFHLEVGIGKGVPYARIHETGGTIVPRTRKMLAIPTRRAKTHAGVSRVGFDKGQGTTNIRSQFPDLFVVKKSGKVFLARAVGKEGKAGRKSSGGGFKGKRAGRGQVEILFTLVPSVRIPPRLGFRKVWKSRVTEIHEELKRVLREAVNG